MKTHIIRNYIKKYGPIAGGIIVCGILFWIYLRYAYLVGYDSDKAVSLLQAKSIMSGKFFRGGEYGLTVNGITTWTLNVLICALVVGFNRMALYVAGAVAYLGIVVFAVYIVWIKNRKQAIMTFGILVIPPPLYVVSYIGTVMHIEAYVMVMILLLWIYRYYIKPDFININCLIKIFIVSFLGNFGDSMFILVFSIPVIMTIAMDFICNKDMLRCKKHILLIGIIVSSMAVAQLLNFFLEYYNIYQWEGYENRYTVTLSELPTKIIQTLEVTLNHYNANVFGIPIVSEQFIFSAIGLIVLFFVSVAFLFTIFNWKNEDIINRFIVVSIIFIYCAVIFTNVSAGIDRYLTPTVYLSALLIGRSDMILYLCNKMGGALRWANIFIFVFLLVPLCRYIDLPQCVIYNAYDELAEFLKEENLSCGYGEFWNSNYITVATDFQTLVLPIGYDFGNNRLHRLAWGNSEQDYFDKAQFVIMDTAETLKEEDIIGVLGMPSKIENFTERFKILIYDYDISSRIYTVSHNIDSVYNAYELINMSKSENVTLEGTQIKMEENGIICEDYVYLQSGTYKCIIKGNNLLPLEYDVYYNLKQLLYPTTELYRDENTIEYIFSLDEDVDALENRMFNNSAEEIGIYSLEIKPYYSE